MRRHLALRLWSTLTLLLLPLIGQANWDQTLTRVAQSVVSLQLEYVRSFDNTQQGISSASGFIVDAERGIILTNRHVVGTGPMTASATLQNQERFDIWPLYRDPIHDFGFFRYDPKQLKTQPPALKLHPEKAKPGLNIRVLGSDGGEQLSILSGTIARIDRPTPRYGRYNYNDYNTFYLQAASSTSGGSSGSPVVDMDGDVIALNAGGNASTASSYYLPLDRIVRALEKLQHNQPITRGSLDTVFHPSPYHYLKRLGLSDSLEQRSRDTTPDSTGMLLVQQVFKGGVAENKLQEGDILLTINQQMVNHFITLETLLDDNVGHTVDLEVLRQGAVTPLKLKINDLYRVLPDQFIEFGDAVLQDMSQQQARAANKPMEGVVVADGGYIFAREGISDGAVITEINGHPITKLDDLSDIIKQTQQGQSWRVRYYLQRRENAPELATVDVNSHWFSQRRCQRQDDQKQWSCNRFSTQPSHHTETEERVNFPTQTEQDPILADLSSTLVKVQFSVPHMADNVYAQHFTGTGIVLDAEEGIVAIDRNTVPINIGDASITFLQTVEIAATPVFFHPRHNLALLKYDPQQVKNLPIKTLDLAASPLKTSAKTQLQMIAVRLDGSFLNQPITSMHRYTPRLPPSHPPRFQQQAADLFELLDTPQTLGGIIVDQEANLHAYWTSFSFQSNGEINEREWGIPTDILKNTLQLYKQQQAYRSLQADLDYLPLSEAASLGLGVEDINKLIVQGSQKVIYVRSVETVQPHLRPGDLIIAVNETPVSSLNHLERLIQHNQVTLTLLRNGQRTTETITPISLPTTGTGEVVHWAGAYIQVPHPAVKRAARSPHGVYISVVARGSAAARDRLYRNTFITAVDGVAINTLDDFLNAVASKKSGEDTRLTLTALNGQRGLVSVRPEYNFWPTFRIQFTEEGWQRIEENPENVALEQ